MILIFLRFVFGYKQATQRLCRFAKLELKCDIAGLNEPLCSIP